ncbi:MAG: restriction endonuclease subunit S [Dechloromonas sp.]|nr:restriction endonuclease subunit S [Dechloromonas sp.]
MSAIGKTCDVVPGKTPAKAAYTSAGDVKIVKFRDVLETGRVDFGNDEDGWFDSRYADDSDLVDLPPKTILLTNAAHSVEHIGKKVAYVEEVPSIAHKVCFVGELTSIRSKDEAECLTKWLFYWLQTNEAKSAIARSVEGAHLVPRQFKRIELPDFSIDVQAEHLGLLDQADDAIQKARAELAAARDLKRSIEAGLLTGQIDKQGRAKVKTKAGMYPQGWAVLPLKTLAVIGSGVTLNQDRAAKENACRYLTVAHVQRGSISSDDPRYLEISADERKTRLLEAGDILVVEGHANSMEIGRAAMFEDMGVETTFQNHLFRVRADANLILPKFLLHILNSERVQRYWNAVCNTSSGLNTINRRNLRNVLIPHPDTTEQQGIVDALDAAEQNVARLAIRAQALKELKRSLLQNLLTGKIRIPEGAIHA